jgi:hypothetical protein
MNGQIGQDLIGMRRGSTLRIEDGAGTLVRVLKGELWLTEEDSCEDHMLQAGQQFRLTRGGAAIAQAFKRSVIALSPAALGWRAA